MEITAIILRILWRLAPALWLEWAVRRLIDWAIALLEDEDHRAWLNQHPRNCFWFGGWLAIIEARLDELIDLKARQLLNWRCDPRDVSAHHPTPAVRSFDDCVLRLARLVHRFQDANRLAQRRAEKLLRLYDTQFIDLSPDHRPTTTTIFAARPVDDDDDDSADSIGSAATRISRSSIENGAAGYYYAAQARGPPHRPIIPPIIFHASTPPSAASGTGNLRPEAGTPNPYSPFPTPSH